MKKATILLAGGLFVNVLHAQTKLPAFRNAHLPVETRVNDLLHTLTLNEKISLLGNHSPAIDRLGIPEYNWWNEALHGVARNGEATVFPQAIAMAATFNEPLVRQVADVISTEARAKYNLAIQQNRREQYMGLTFWTPNINIFRDPRWGRGQETYGEDPFLTATMGTAFVKGLQGTNARYLKTAACAKHFAVHSGPEAERNGFNAVIDEKDLRETYLYAFKKLVDVHVEAVMCAYNRVNNEPCCTGQSLLHNILHNEWKFAGHTVTDCGALYNVVSYHKTYTTREETAAAAIMAGVDLECGGLLQADVKKAIDKGLLTEKEIDGAIAKTLLTQMKLGFFDNPAAIPYSKYGADSVHNTTHISLTRRVAAQAMVLLKNSGNLLPLQKAKYPSIMVVGPNAGSLDALMANYHGISGNMVTFAEGIANAAGPATAVDYDQGCDFTDTTHFGGIWAAGNSSLTIAIVGLTPLLEGEAGDAFLSTGDKTTLSLPRSHIVYLKKLRASSKKPIVVVVTAGSAVDIKEIEPYADAVVLAWYPGEQGGNALADVLFGKVNPSGRLPVTFYNTLNDVPAFDNYAMKDRTYRYFRGNVQYPFGFGLSYTSFSYTWKQHPADVYKRDDSIRCSVSIANTGAYDGEEALQAYVEYPSMERMPIKELKAFKKVAIRKNETTIVNLSIAVSELRKWDLNTNSWKLYPGQYKIVIGKNAKEELLSHAFAIQ
ncbi:MAG: glycoside hydrolase family 3 C-terminal domain-containing protein [Filimonas sp.]|nr:glycoside hydrolase family 3 C-terminal domain-containing protein [Filimonas sp.]